MSSAAGLLGLVVAFGVAELSIGAVDAGGAGTNVPEVSGGAGDGFELGPVSGKAGESAVHPAEQVNRCSGHGSDKYIYTSRAL